MWPKAFAQLVELAPHITRLLPLADRFLKDKTSSEDATRRALAEHRQTLDAMSERLRSDVGQVAAQLGQVTTEVASQQATLQRQIADLEKHLSSTRGDALAAKVAAESIEGRLARVESRQGRLNTLVIVAVVLLVAILIVLAVPVLRGR